MVLLLMVCVSIAFAAWSLVRVNYGADEYRAYAFKRYLEERGESDETV